MSHDATCCVFIIVDEVLIYCTDFDPEDDIQLVRVPTIDFDSDDDDPLAD